MRLRNSSENVKRIKEEIEHLNYIMNPYNVTMGYSNIETKVSQVVE